MRYDVALPLFVPLYISTSYFTALPLRLEKYKTNASARITYKVCNGGSVIGCCVHYYYGVPSCHEKFCDGQFGRGASPLKSKLFDKNEQK